MVWKTTTRSVRKSQKPRELDSKAHPKDGERLKIIRCLNKKTQKKFAEEIGVSVGTVANHEKGRTEIPISTSRKVFIETGKNPTPLNPEEDPRLLLPNAYSLMVEKDMEKPRSIFEKVALKRERYSKLRAKIFSPARRFVDEAIHAIFSTAAGVFWIEQVRRVVIQSNQETSLVRDVSYVGAFLIIVILFIPMILSIPWGIKTEQDS